MKTLASITCLVCVCDIVHSAACDTLRVFVFMQNRRYLRNSVRDRKRERKRQNKREKER